MVLWLNAINLEYYYNWVKKVTAIYKQGKHSCFCSLQLFSLYNGLQLLQYLVSNHGSIALFNELFSKSICSGNFDKIIQVLLIQAK